MVFLNLPIDLLQILPVPEALLNKACSAVAKMTAISKSGYIQTLCLKVQSNYSKYAQVFSTKAIQYWQFCTRLK